MGLNINTFTKSGKRISEYERLGSYHTIHILRQWLLIHAEGNSKELVEQAYSYIDDKADEAWKKMKIEKFPRFIDHSDCDGGYKSFKAYKTAKRNNWEYQNLDELREELKLMKKDYYDQMDEDSQWVFNKFDEIINKKTADGEESVKVEFT